MIVILLTTTVNTQNHISWLKQRNTKEREKMYINIINLWLSKTNFKIVVVENSGHNFNIKNEKLELISFTYPKKDKVLLDKMEAKGQHEIYSISYACKNSTFINKCDFIIKITGRYFIPSLEDILNKNLNDKINFIRQSSIWRKMNRCELIGCSKNCIDKLFYFPLKNDMMEQEMMDRMKISKDILNLPKMKLHKKTRQGVGSIIQIL